MSLRLQLLAFGLLTLALPWAGLRFVQQMEAALRSGLEASLLASAGTVATALANAEEFDLVPRSVPGNSPDATIYAHELTLPPRVDGFRADWVFTRPPMGAAEMPAGIQLNGIHGVWSGVSGRFAYFFFAVSDADVIYPTTPGVPPFGDRIAFLLDSSAGSSSALLLSTAAPGVFRARVTDPVRFVPGDRYEDRVLGAWQETADGFDVEVRIPLGMIEDAVGFAVIDVDRRDGGYGAELLATWQGDDAAPSRFVFARSELDRVVERFTRVGDRFRILDANGWVLADKGALASDAGVSVSTGSVAERFFRFALRRNDPVYDGLEVPPGRLGDNALASVLTGAPATAWFRQGPSSTAVVAAAVPVQRASGQIGTVILEQASDSVLTLTNQALMRLMSFTVLVSMIAAAGLLAYATFLSLRVRRLARAAESALGPRGEINVRLPGGSARDEIGDLSRSFQDLLGRLSDYNQYLKTLTGKLAHELRTPLAIVSTSVDNLEHETHGDSAAEYLARLRQGAGRLEAVLAAMSAATRVEQAMDRTETEVFDLSALLSGCTQAYRDVYPDREFKLGTPTAPQMVRGSADLMAQLLDKLVDNAQSFGEPGTPIELALDELDDHLVLSVTNRGPCLPETMKKHLFDSLVSVRSAGDEKPHLGLGLYIVALVAKFHGGRVEAQNLADGSGVVIRVQIPRSGALA